VLKTSPTFESPRCRYVIIITILYRLRIPQGKKNKNNVSLAIVWLLNKSHHLQTNNKKPSGRLFVLVDPVSIANVSDFGC